MNRKKGKIWWFSSALIILVGYFIWDSYSQPTISDIPGDFEEVAFVRNEQNKGGIIRVYAVTVGNPSQALYEECADMLPVNDYGSVTKVYFFDKNQPYPTTLHIDEPHFDTDKFEAIRIVRRHGARE